MATKPTDPDDLDVRLSWPQGSRAEPSAGKSRATSRAPATRSGGGRASGSAGEASTSGSDRDALLDVVGRLERLEAEFRARIEELAERVDRLGSAAAGDTERVLKAVESIRRRLPVSARPAPPVTEGQASPSAPPARRPRS